MQVTRAGEYAIIGLLYLAKQPAERMVMIDEVSEAEGVPKSFLAKIFQALRIEVNNELENLKRVLSDSVDFLSPGGRIAVVSYHSLEDRIVKNFMKENSVKESVSKYKPGSASIKKILEILTKKPIVPTRQEVKLNPKARSAKLRAAEKI